MDTNAILSAVLTLHSLINPSIALKIEKSQSQGFAGVRAIPQQLADPDFRSSAIRQDVNDSLCTAAYVSRPLRLLLRFQHLRHRFHSLPLTHSGDALAPCAGNGAGCRVIGQTGRSRSYSY
nr:hypothetical protein Itr_chr10CG03160 [Ipomoea trifida]